MTQRQLPDPEELYPWKQRRRVIFVTLGVCFLGVTYLTLWGADSRLNDTLALGYFALAGSTVGSYVFGAVWQDVTLIRKRPPRYAEFNRYDNVTSDDDNEDETPNG